MDNRRCIICSKRTEEGYNFCGNCRTFTPPLEEGGERAEAQPSLYFLTSDHSFSSDKKSYEMRKINPAGRGSDKYYWFICTPNFPSEQHKVNDPHCHARKNDWSGEARISLDPTTHEPSKLKVKLGKISEPD